MTEQSQRLHLTSPRHLSLARGKPNRRYKCSLIAAGPLDGHGLHVAGDVLQASVDKFAGVAAFVDHSWLPRVDRLAGQFTNVAYDEAAQAITGELVLKDTPTADWLQRIIDEVIADQAGDTDAPPLNIGLSADCWISTGPRSDVDGLAPVLSFLEVSSVDVVFRPASNGARFDRILAQAGPFRPAQFQTQEVPMPEEATQPATPAIAPTPATAAATPPSVADLHAELADLRAELTRLAERNAITGFDTPRSQPVTAGQMTTPADQAQAITDWQFGVPNAPLPEPTMRSPRMFYHAFTGDLAFTGRVDPARAQFAAASTTNLADLAANAMNKVIIATWPALEAYRWFEQLVTVQPNDGSVHDMAWISFGGLGNLPVVAQGAAYSELTVADSKESDAFAKYGGYVGVTEEMYRNSDLARMQAIPRALAVAAVRTRSAAIAAIFTAQSGTGPTLDDDSQVLFYSGHGSNVQTTAFSKTAWTAARLECYKHGELGSSKRLALYPKYALVPADLFENALEIFGYGAGPGGYANGANSTVDNVNYTGVARSTWDPRPVPVVVPDWTDTNDWAYLVDPMLHPVLMMSYAQAPGGGTHPMPELFSVSSPTVGLTFSNDVLPIKVRDWFSYGVATWRGVGKRNVA